MKPSLLALCSCGRARAGWTLSSVTGWRDWNASKYGTGLDHTVWIGANEHPPQPLRAYYCVIKAVRKETP